MDRYETKARELRQLLHKIPEPSMYERKTKAAIISFLQQETNLTIVDRGNWFYAYYHCNTAKTSIAFRADYDAVTGEDGISRHLCGHDGHSAILAAFGLWVSENRPSQNIYLIFQPGEESGEGAFLCRKIFEEEQIDEIYGIHNIPGVPTGNILIKRGTFACASAGLAIKFTGSPAHAAYPEYGLNPARAIAELVLKITDQKNELHRGMVLSTMIGIEMGSCHFGVSASEGTIRCTLRAEYLDEFQKLLSNIKATAAGIAQKHHLLYRITEHDIFPSTENEDRCLDKVELAANRCGIRTQNLDTPFRWSEDFGWYLQKVPGAFFGVGAGERCPELHTKEYKFPDEIISYVLKVYQELAKDKGA